MTLHQQDGQCLPRLAAAPHHDAKLREEARHRVDAFDLLWRERDPFPRHAEARADRELELHTLREQREAVGVVDGEEAERRGEGDGAQQPFAGEALDPPQLLGAAARIGLGASEEPAGRLRQGRARQLGVFVQREPRLLDAEAVELALRGTKARLERGAPETRRAVEGVDDREQGLLLREGTF